MMEEVNSPAYAMKIETSTKEKTDEQKEDLAYSTLNTTDLDDSSFRMDNISDDSDGDKEENGDLLEPFPEIDHDRRPRDADRNFFAEDEDDDDILRPGDHVYVWKSMGFFGVKTYQKHGIVLNVDPDDDTNVEIATFYHKNPRHKSFRRDDEDDFGNVDHYDLDNIKQPSDGNPKVPRGYSDQHYGCEQTQTLTSTPVQPETKTSSSYYDNAHESKMSSHSGNSTSFTNSPTAKKEPKFTATVRIESLASFASNAKSEIKKVKYNLSLAKRVLRSGGTVTSCKADEADLVVARARFLLDTNPESATKTVMGMGITGEEEYSRELEQSIPDFHMLSANGECAAVWCRTGRWCTLQGSSILHILIVSQAGGAVAGGAIASNIMLWAPMPGFWGSIGYIWYVPATIAFPILVPILIGFGLASLVPLEVLRRFRKKWAQITREMNTAFWSKADGEVRHNYASNDSTKESWVKDFFMDDATKKDKQKGSYMPLGSNGDDDIGIDDDSDEDDEFTKKVAAEYGMYSPNGEKGHKGKESEIEFSEKWKSTTKEEWQSLASKVNASAASEKDNNDKGSHRELV